MKRINHKNGITNNNIRQCAICGCDTGDAYLKTPYGTYVCPDCCTTVFEIVCDVLEKCSDNEDFSLEENFTNSYEYNPLSPIFIDQDSFF
jgi:hypothetical protein